MNVSGLLKLPVQNEGGQGAPSAADLAGASRKVEASIAYLGRAYVGSVPNSGRPYVTLPQQIFKTRKILAGLPSNPGTKSNQTELLGWPCKLVLVWLNAACFEVITGRSVSCQRGAAACQSWWVFKKQHWGKLVCKECWDLRRMQESHGSGKTGLNQVFGSGPITI